MSSSSSSPYTYNVNSWEGSPSLTDQNRCQIENELYTFHDSVNLVITSFTLEGAK